MYDSLWEQTGLLLRIIAAAVCGAAIGFERKNRAKGAGVRTHLIVALASALMMVVSKYGFFDVLGAKIDLDPSRVAGGVVTGVGFLGAGLILARKTGVSGITTAAGIWATVGVGMTVGAGMYFIGVLSTVLILLCQFILHKDFAWLQEPVTRQAILQTDGSGEVIPELSSRMKLHRVEVISLRTRQSGGTAQIKLYAKFPAKYSVPDMADLFGRIPHVTAVEL